jgi:hypothetical protein
MPSSPSEPDRSESHRGSTTDGDFSTDPGRAHPYESLYRNASGEPAKPHRPTARHWEPSLRPPEGEHQGFGWLYREEPAADPPAEAAGDRLPDPAQPVGRAEPASAPPPRRFRTGRVVLVVLIALVVAMLIGAAVVSSQHQGTPGGQDTPAASPFLTSPTPALSPVQPTQAVASCQAEPATDDAGTPVSYLPSNLTDNDPTTAWRCPGSGTAQTLTFTFASATDIAQVGLINGYAKVDPASGAHRYGEYRRATQVTWTFPDGTAINQTLSDGVETVQQLTIPARSTAQVTLTIDSTTAPGSNVASRDALLISEVSFAAAG